MKATIWRAFRTTLSLLKANELRVVWNNTSIPLPVAEEYHELITSLKDKVDAGPFLLRETGSDLIFTEFDYKASVEEAKDILELEVDILGKGGMIFIDSNPITSSPSPRPLSEICGEADRLMQDSNYIEAATVLREGLTHISPLTELTQDLLNFYSLYASCQHQMEKPEGIDRIVGFFVYNLISGSLALTRPVAEMLYLQGVRYKDEERTNEAVEILTKAADFEGESEEDIGLRTSILVSLANTYDNEEAYELAKETADRGLKVLKDANLMNVPYAGRLLHIKANAEMFRVNMPEAKTLLEAALKIYDESEETGELYFAALCKDLGELYFYLKMYKEAEPLMTRAIELLVGMEILAESNAIAVDLIRTKTILRKFAEAQVVFTEAMSRPKDQHYNAIKLATAEMYFIQERFDDALVLATEVNADLKAADDEDEEYPGLLAMSQLLLGKIHVSRQDYGAAEPLLRQALKEVRDYPKKMEDATMSIYFELGRLYSEQSFPEKALPYAKKAYEIANDNDEFDLILRAQVNELLGNVMFEGGSTEGVRGLFKSALKLRLKALGFKNPELLEAYNNYGSFLLQTNEVYKAEPVLLKALELVRANSLSLDAPHVRNLFKLLLELYKAKDDSDAVVRLERILGDESK